MVSVDVLSTCVLGFIQKNKLLSVQIGHGFKKLLLDFHTEYIRRAIILYFNRTPAQVAFMQWGNQSFNALVNYTNRNAASQVTTKQTLFAYVSATGTALGKFRDDFFCEPQCAAL